MRVETLPARRPSGEVNGKARGNLKDGYDHG